jgi:peptide/nickel transport system substrate-binding protein
VLEFLVLGPLEARGATGNIAFGGRKQSVVLAVLLLRAGEFVSREALIDAVWPQAPPPSAGSTIESYVSRLRRVLHDAGGDGQVIESGPAGYRLARNASRIDVEEFGQLAAAARTALANGDADEAAAGAGAALSLWRGPALAGLAGQPALRADAGALEERRTDVLETFAEAALRSGRAGEVIARLSAEVARHPARERLRALLMLALYRAGRQADALQAYQDARSYLVAELGLEPGGELRALQDRILRQDPSLDEPRRRRPGHTATEPDAERVAVPVRRKRRRAAVAIAGLSAAAVFGVTVVIATGGSSRPALAGSLRVPALGLLDPATGQPRAAGTLSAAASRIMTSEGADWATSYDNGTLLRIDPHRLLVTQTVDVGHGPTGVAVAAGDVWVALSLDGMLSRVDLATNAVVQRVPVGTDPTDLAAGDRAVWVSNTGDGTVSKVDAHTGAVLATTPVGPQPKGIAVGAGAVWVAESAANVVARLDPRTGRVLDRISTGQGPTQIGVGRDGVWVANELDSTVSLIDPSTDTVTLTRAVAGIPGAVAVSSGGVWVAATDRPTLTLVQASGAMRQIQLASPPTSLAATSAGVLVAVRGAGANHRGGTVFVRTASAPLAQITPEQCCNMPPDVRDLSYDGLLSTSKLPSSAGTLVPDLALAIPRAQEGGRLYTFRLRPGMRYWNGAPVRASDFLRGLELAAASSDVWAGYIGALPGALACPRQPRSCDLTKAVIPDDRAGTITLQLSHPDPDLLSALGLSAFAPAPPTSGGIRPGTGPYRIASFTPNQNVIYERNPYFRDSAPVAQPAGFPDRIEIKASTSNSADINAVLNGQADYTFDTPTPDQLNQIELHQPGQLHVSPLPSVDFLFLNTHAPPFNDLRVRQALNYAVDRAAIVKLIGGPAAATPDCQTIPVTIPGHTPYCPYTRTPSRNGRWTAQNLAKANALIAASGTRGTSVSVLTQDSGLVSDAPVARYFVALLRQLGFRAHLRLLQPDRYQAAIDDYRHPAQIGTDSWVADFPSATQYITAQLSCAAWNPPTRLHNHAQLCNNQTDGLAARAAQLEQTDPVTANHLWARADQLATNLAPWVPTVSEHEIDLVSHRAGDYEFVPTVGALIDQLWVK